MPRVKRGVTSLKKRKKILKYAKGFMWGRKSKERLAREALLHSWRDEFRGRRERKREMRRLWQIQVNAAAREAGLPYNTLIHRLKQKSIMLDRKILATLAEHHPELFTAIVTRATQ